MAEKVVEAKEATETLHAQETEATVTHAPVTEGIEPNVFFSVVIPGTPSKEEADSEEFTREAFEGALDKVSRPLKGRFGHVPYSTDDLIRDKRADAELEDC
jgi:hypothetical protein